MTNNLEQEIRAVVANMENQENQGNPPPQEDIQDIYVLIVREQEEAEDHRQVVDSTPLVTRQQDSFVSAYVFVCFALFLILATLTFQLYCIVNPPIATISIIPKSQQVTLTGTVQLGRVLPPLTISQSQTTKATGHGHQPAAQARGYITLYNGQLTSVFVPAGTFFTGASGIQVITDQDATIPAANLPQVGHVTVSAHAINAGVQGNIPSYDINQACCATAIKAVNTNSFYGGVDARDFQTVTKSDITNAATPLKAAVTQSMKGALEATARQNESIITLPCNPTVTPNHQPGQEATTVKVTVSEICSAVSYNNQELQTKATAYLASEAQHKAEAGYSLFGTVHVWVKQASVTSTAPHLVFLSFQASGTWIYGLTHQAQEQIKHLIAGKTTQEAQNLLAAMPGVESAAIRFSGFGDATKLPKTTGYIHLTLIVV